MIILSYTSFSAFKSCPYLFKKKYVERVKPLIPQNNRWFVEGSVVHRCLEAGFKHSKPIDKDYVLSIFDTTFDRVFQEQKNQGVILFLPNETVDSIKAKCLETLRMSIDTIRKLGMDQGDFHSEFTIGTYREPFELVKGLYIQGSVDWVRDLGENLIVSDFKTSRDTTFIKIMQLLIYVIALEKKLGKPVSQAFYLMFRSGAKVDVTLTDQKRKEAVDLLLEVNNKINVGDFTANPAEKLCKECVYRNICEFSAIKYGPKETSFESSSGS